MKAWLRDVVHNCLVHPLLPFLPVRVADRFHDANADWAFRRERFDERAIEHRMAGRGVQDGDAGA